MASWADQEAHISFHSWKYTSISILTTMEILYLLLTVKTASIPDIHQATNFSS